MKFDANSCDGINFNLPKVFIIIVNWKGAKDTIELLESLKKIIYPNYEVVVVDNASGGNEAQILKERYGDYTHVIENDRNYGFARGFIIGIRFALERCADYVLLMHNDTVVEPNFLSQLMKLAEGDPRIGMLSPIVYRYDRPNEIEWAGVEIVWFGLKSTTPSWNADQKVLKCDYLYPICMLIKKSKIKATGIMQAMEDFFLYGDFFWSLSILRSGLKLAYVPDAKIWHKRSRSLERVIAADKLRWWVRDNITLRYRFLRDRYYLGLNAYQFIYYLLSIFIFQPSWHLYRLIAGFLR